MGRQGTKGSPQAFPRQALQGMSNPVQHSVVEERLHAILDGTRRADVTELWVSACRQIAAVPAESWRPDRPLSAPVTPLERGIGEASYTVKAP
jgi:hypothetical protein